MKYPTYLKISFCIFLKYMIFFLFLMFRNKDYYFIRPGIRDGSDLFYYLWLLLSLPLLTIIVFGIPIYYSFRVKSIFLFFLLLSAFVVGEYFLYTYLASPSDSTNGLYNAFLTVLFFSLFFYKEFGFKLKQKPENSWLKWVSILYVFFNHSSEWFFHNCIVKIIDLPPLNRTVLN